MTDGVPVNGGSGGEGQQLLTAADVAARTGGELRGRGDVVLHGIAPLDRAGPDDLSILSHERYVGAYATTQAGAVLVAPRLADLTGPALTRIVVERPADALVQVLGRFHRPEHRTPGVDASARIAASAVVASDVTIEANVVIGDGVTVGEGCWIGANSVIGAFSELGRSVRLHPNVVVYPRVRIGDRVVLHAGARVGREGFGFVPRPDGVVRIPHIGQCVLEDDVEVGANSCIDRGSIDDTIIGMGTKIDNLVHVAHNVRIGRFCFIAAQVGIAGSTRIEDGVQLGGQVGVNGHTVIRARATIAGQAGVFGEVPAGETWSGYPARPHREELRRQAALNRLARLLKPIERWLGAAGPAEER